MPSSAPVLTIASPTTRSALTAIRAGLEKPARISLGPSTGLPWAPTSGSAWNSSSSAPRIPSPVSSTGSSSAA